MVARIASFVLGAVFLLSATTKLADLRRWNTQSAALGVPVHLAMPVPFVEITLAALLVARVAPRVVPWLAIAVLVGFTAFLVRRIRQGQRPPCACFGAFSSKPIGWGHVARNALFIAVGVVAALA